MKRRPARVRGQVGELRPAPAFLAALVADVARRLRARSELVRRCGRRMTGANVHRLRVDSRRLLARLELVADVVPAWADKAGSRTLRKQIRLLGEIRDLQIQARILDELLPRHPELAAYRRRVRRDALLLRREVSRRLLRPKPARRLRDLAVELAAVSDSTDLGREAFERPLRRARAELVRREAASRRGTGLHRLRLALKRCRYLTEALQPLLPASTAAQLGELRRWQTRLGDIHDLEVLAERLRDYAGKHRVPGRYAGVRRILACRRRRLAAHRFAISGVRGEARWDFGSVRLR
jgi:CHAD domain-containing protein